MSAAYSLWTSWRRRPQSQLLKVAGDPLEAVSLVSRRYQRVPCSFIGRCGVCPGKLGVAYRGGGLCRGVKSVTLATLTSAARSTSTRSAAG
jgi:hypothetical protein